jgi:hypothetical protein
MAPEMAQIQDFLKNPPIIGFQRRDEIPAFSLNYFPSFGVSELPIREGPRKKAELGLFHSAEEPTTSRGKLKYNIVDHKMNIRGKG